MKQSLGLSQCASRDLQKQYVNISQFFSVIPFYKKKNYPIS